MADEPTVLAAGGVIWRRVPGHADSDGDAVEVLLVHRARYDDWTFPKGKLDPGETWEEAALREVREETGVVAELGPELATTDYRDAQGRTKRVRYWSMTEQSSDGFESNDEITAVRWVPLDGVADLLTYRRDEPVLRSFVASRPFTASGPNRAVER